MNRKISVFVSADDDELNVPREIIHINRQQVKSKYHSSFACVYGCMHVFTFYHKDRAVSVFFASNFCI